LNPQFKPTNQQTNKQTNKKNPGLTFSYILIALAGLVFALVAGIKYNSVKVFNRSIRTESISNTLWILFYIFTALRHLPSPPQQQPTTTNNNNQQPTTTNNIMMPLSLLSAALGPYAKIEVR